MNTNHTHSIEQVYKARLRVMVDTERNKVLYAEAGKDFVDALFSFLTLPLGTIARLVAKDSNMKPVTIGSLSSLYQSVVGLDEQYLWTHTCKEMLMQPRNSMETHCQQLKLSIDDTEPVQYFICENLICSRKGSVGVGLLSTYRNQNCSCGKVLNRVIIQESLIGENGFVKENASFIVCDDLYVRPNVIGTSINLIQNLGVRNIQAIEEKAVYFSRKEVLDLLKLSMISKTPLTDFVFRNNNQSLHSLNPRNQSEFVTGDGSPYEGRSMTVKLQVRKSTGEVLYAEAEEDFADLLLSFLTFPLGGVLHMLQGFSSVSCIDNLYNSMSELSPDRHLMSHDLKNNLVMPQCAPQFGLKNQILPIAAAPIPKFNCLTYCCLPGFKLQCTLTSTPKCIGNNDSYEMNTQLCLVDPKFCKSKSSSSGEYAKGPSMFLVTDNLVVTPMSSVSALSYLVGSNVPLFDLEEMSIRIGVKEGLSILKASMTSTSALTNGLSQFIKANHGGLLIKHELADVED